MSAGLTASASLLNGVGQYESAQERAKLFRANSGIAAAQSQSTLAAAATNESAQRLRAQATTGQQVAAIGANGLQQTGTNAQVVASTSALNELSALEIRNNAARKAWGYQVEEESDQQQGDFAAHSGVTQALGSVISGGARSSDQATKAGGWF